MQQFQILNFLKKHKQEFVVIDSNILLNNPKKILSKWCKKIRIDYDSKMLSWKQGEHRYDGRWGKLWYNNVVMSTGFIKPYYKKVTLDESYQQIYEESLFYYNQLLRFCLK